MRRVRTLLTLAPLLALGLASAGCSERPRANPFDPRNTSTGGRPQAFAALAGSGLVRLGWRGVGTAGLVGYQLLRLDPGDSLYRDRFGPIGPQVDTLVDFSVQNRSTYSYRLYYVFASGPGSLYAEDVATPSPVQPWVVQVNPGSLLRLSADGRRTVSSAGGFSSPNRVAVNPATGHVWVANTFAGEVVVFDERGGLLRRIGGFGFPTAIAVDAGDGSAWVCDEGTQGEVRHLDEAGQPVGLNPTFGPLDTPTGVAADPRTRDVWVCERGANRLFKLDRDGYPLLPVPRDVPGPSRAAVDSLTGEVWVTDFDGGRVFKFAPNGAPLDTVSGLAGALGVAVDHRRGLVWVAGGRANAVVALDRNGSPVARLDNVLGPRHLAVELGSGEAWVVDSADELLRVAPSGALVLRRGGLAAPADVALGP